ncbi:SDR family oxidoreductase [Rhodobacteraceae bacterium NNCM2]|nr:SDR family oxidoreductase [Coraliihabitans acroporae]
MKTAIITGGGSGIGAATAIRIREKGFEPVVVGLDKTDELPDDITFIEADVRDEKRFAEIVAEYPDLAALGNIAGVVRHEQEWTAEGFSFVLDVNLRAMMSCCQAALPALERNQGSIVNISSVWGHFGSPRTPAYSASKTGVQGLTRSLAAAWGPKGVRVNAVSPGWVYTRVSQVALDDVDRRNKLLERIPMGRLGVPDDIAKGICFLMSDEAGYVNGACLPVDGGFTAN